MADSVNKHMSEAINTDVLAQVLEQHRLLGSVGTYQMLVHDGEYMYHLASSEEFAKRLIEDYNKVLNNETDSATERT